MPTKEPFKSFKDDTPKSVKVNYFEKQVRSGRREVYSGLKLIKKNIGKPLAKKGLRKVEFGHLKVRFAKRELKKLGKKKYWK